MVRIPLLVFVLLLWATPFQAQTSLVESISIEQGLSQGFVPAICQDEDGFLWFGTKNGLNRYDGYGFQVFKNDPFDTLSLNNNEVIGLASTGDFLVVVTFSDRLNLFHRKTQRFLSIPFPVSMTFGVFRKIFFIGKNAVGILHWDGENESLYRVHWPTDLSEQLENGANPASLVQVEILEKRPVLLDADVSADGKKIWLFTGGAVLIRDIQTGDIRQLDLPAPFANPPYPRDEPTCIVVDMAGATWVSRNRQITRFNGRDWKVFTLPFSPSVLLCTDRKSNVLWFRADRTIYGLDVNKIPFTTQPTWRLELDKTPKSGFSDPFGNIWIGTDAHGIRKFIPHSGAVKNYMEGFSIYCRPLFDEKRHVLLNDVRRGGWYSRILDLDTGQAQSFEDAGLQNLLGGLSVTTENGRFWLISYQGNGKLPLLIRFDLETRSKDIIPIPEGFKWGEPVLQYIPPDKIWFVSAFQLGCFDIPRRSFSFFDFPEKFQGGLIAFERSPNGTWWIGTTDGLLKAEPDGAGQFRFSTLRAQKGKRNSLPTNSIKSLLPDPADPNVLWIGTAGHGMSRLDIAKNQFTHYTTKNGLPDDVVYGILADDETPRNLWISTNRGLARFSPETGPFQYYFKTDGLQDNEFNTYAAFKSPSGKFFFGGVNGLTVFDPKDLKANTEPPKVRFTGLKINGLEVGPRDSNAILKKDIAFLEQLELPFSRNSIVLQFAATDYTAPQRNQFAYYLEGAEPQWAHRGFEHSAQYLNLAPGTYTFRVKVANSSGVWNERPISLAIVIRAPWYRTWWAYLAYAALFSGAVFLFYQNQLRRKLEHAEAERLKSLDAFKSRFFTNITHEFRTPLTVILGMADRLQQGGASEKSPSELSSLGLIKRSGENLLRLVNQILDLAKLESNTLKMHYVQGDLLAYVRYITESLHSFANAQNVLLRVESKEQDIVMDYDPERVLQIIYNLLSNAIKFTPSGGQVVVRLAVENLSGDIQQARGITNSGRKVSISVTDTGAGISRQDLPNVFDRFFQAQNQEHTKTGGTGIGLSLTRELLRAMGGDIVVQSTLGRGTTFTAHVPISNKAPLLQKLPGQPAHLPGIRPTPALPDLKALSDPADASMPHLLLIEDNPDVVEYLAACLSTAYRLDFAYNGRAGIEKALEIVPDLIISDVMMPEKDGFEVVETLKNDERTSHIPIVLLTARATVEDRVAGLRRGADAYLAKPFREEELLVWVAQLIARRRLLQARYTRLSAPPEEAEPAAAELILEDDFIQKFRTVLEANYSDSEFSIEALCREMAMSRTQVHRKLTALTNRSTTEHINAYRLERAREHLKSGSMTVTEVAYAVGFNDPKYFSRLFTEMYGMVPSALRK
jgi:signal transduction histidine kinase/DNA-binding response OmpR family regulator